MADVVEKYFNLELRRLQESLTEAQEDAILEDLDDLWWSMTTDEQQRCRDAVLRSQPASQDAHDNGPADLNP